MDNQKLAKFIAELFNGGKWEDPKFYTTEQMQLWVTRAKAVQRFMLQEETIQLTLDQIKALYRVYDRVHIYLHKDGMTHSKPEYDGQNSLLFNDFCDLVQLGSDCIMIPWCGMWLGIEKDGYTHS